MDKVKMTTPDGVTENIEKLSALFPAAVTEMRGEDGTLRKGIDFEKLKQLLSRDIVEGGERYEFSWVGKKAAMAEAARPTTETLRPVKADSRNWDTTENLYIEGDNLAALKILQESYLGKVKMIYIDPPYNTGNDFIYKDNTTHTQYEEDTRIGMFDEDDNHLFKNIDTNGRFHSDWCSMIYTRLRIARNFLTDNGAIFISIDDHENDNIKKLCNEVFGEHNFVACVVWQRNYAPISLKKFFSESHEYCFVYAKNINSFEMNLLPRTEKQNKDYTNPDNDPRGVWKVGNLTVGPAVEKQVYEITGPTGKKFLPPSGYCWRFTQERFAELRKDNRIWFGSDGNGSPVPKLFLTEVQNGVTPMTLWTFDEAGHNQIATRELRDIFGKSIFTSPKPTKYILRYLQIGSNADDIILDFFSGSATTAHAIMQLNAEDGGHRKFIMVQLPEPCDEKSEAYKVGYKNICEIGKERIRRAGDKIKAEHPDADLDIGFRVFRVDSSNMRDVYYKPEEFTQTMLGEAVSNIKPDRTDLDLLYACLLDCGVPIHLPHITTTVDGCTIHNVDNGALMACFDEHIPNSVIRAMAAEAPLQVILRDSAFAADADKINVTEIFKNLSPDTKVRVI